MTLAVGVVVDAERSFFAVVRLAGQTDTATLSNSILRENSRRTGEGRPDTFCPIRPDHSHRDRQDADHGTPDELSDIRRLKRLAESLRGAAAQTQLA